MSNPFDSFLNKPVDMDKSKTIQKLHHTGEYVHRGEPYYHDSRYEKIENSGLVKINEVFYKKYHCLHLTTKNSFGAEIQEFPRERYPELQIEYERNGGYLIVCSKCVFTCEACAATSSVITGEKITKKLPDETEQSLMLCSACAKIAKKDAFFEKLKSWMKNL